MRVLKALDQEEVDIRKNPTLKTKIFKTLQEDRAMHRKRSHEQIATTVQVSKDSLAVDADTETIKNPKSVNSSKISAPAMPTTSIAHLTKDLSKMYTNSKNRQFTF